LGGIEAINKAFKGLTGRMRVKCEGNKIELPSLEGVILLNIPSYGGGVDLWGNREEYLSDSSEPKMGKNRAFALQDKQDGLIELAGIYSSLHLGECQIGMSEVLKLAQGRGFEIIIDGKDSILFQVDGEPYSIKGPAKIEVFRKDQVKILMKTTERYQYVAKKAVDVLEWANEQGVINTAQKNTILNEFSKRSKI
jgi:diacylglycerol kinase (ATP)